MGVFFKLLIHYYYKHILSTRPDMKFSAVLLVLACAYSAYGLDCLVGKGKAAVKKACASRDTKCQGPLYKPDEGYGDATKAVEFKCGACSKVGTKAGECVDSNAALVYKEFHTNKCYKYKYNKEAKDGEKWEVEVDAQKKQVEEPCTGERKAVQIATKSCVTVQEPSSHHWCPYSLSFTPCCRLECRTLSEQSNIAA